MIGIIKKEVEKKWKKQANDETKTVRRKEDRDGEKKNTMVQQCNGKVEKAMVKQRNDEKREKNLSFRVREKRRKRYQRYLGHGKRYLPAMGRGKRRGFSFSICLCLMIGLQSVLDLKLNRIEIQSFFTFMPIGLFLEIEILTKSRFGLVRLVQFGKNAQAYAIHR